MCFKMKCIVVSDIHGSIESANILIDKFHKFDCNQIICLGDVLYHGPRNDLPLHYEPKKVVALLNQYADKILCIQGNCDAEVDQMVLDFKFEKEMDFLMNDAFCHFEHGHHLEDYVYKAQFIFYGHTHLPLMKETNGHQIFNPGSITLPKENNPRTYMLWENHTITLRDIDDNILKTFTY